MRLYYSGNGKVSVSNGPTDSLGYVLEILSHLKKATDVWKCCQNWPQQGWIQPLWRTQRWWDWCLQEPQNWTGQAHVDDDDKRVEKCFTFSDNSMYLGYKIWDTRCEIWDKSVPAEAEDCTVCPEAGLWWRVERWGKGKDGGGSAPPRPFSLCLSSFKPFVPCWPSSRVTLLIPYVHLLCLQSMRSR